MKPLPKTLAICGVPWKIRRRTMKQYNGLCDPNKLTIYIDPTVPIETAWGALMHEVLHAIEFATEGDRSFLNTAARKCAGRRKDKQAIDDVLHHFIYQIDEPLMVFLRDNFGVGV